MARNMAWLDNVNAVWRQVGREIGAEFEVREYNMSGRHNTLRAALVRKTERLTITLEYRAECKFGYDDNDYYQTTTTMKGHLVDKVQGEGYTLKTNNADEVNAFLREEKEETIQKLMQEALGRSSLSLGANCLSFREGSEDRAPPGAWALFFGTNWMIPISDPWRLKSLFSLFEAILRRMERPAFQRALEIDKVRTKELAEELDKVRAKILPELLEETLQLYVELTNLGIDARVLEQGPAPNEGGKGGDQSEMIFGFPAEPSWIEIRNSPIRWVAVVGSEEGYEVFATWWFIPDPHIGADSPLVNLYPSIVKSHRFFGREIGLFTA